MLRRFIAGVLVACIVTSSTWANSPSFVGNPHSEEWTQLAGRFGTITETYSPTANSPAQPEVILIQNLHCNRSVQHAISSILERLQKLSLLPQHIAAEGLVGNYNLHPIQALPNPKWRRLVSDQLVEEGKLPGVLHFLITQGKGNVFGVETKDLYENSVSLWQHSYKGRQAVLQSLSRVSAALKNLRQETSLSSNLKLLQEDVDVLKNLVDQNVVPERVSMTLQRSSTAWQHLMTVWPEQFDINAMQAAASSADFYALAKLRDQSLFDNFMTLRTTDHQATSVLVVGGFHTLGITDRLKKAHLSYVVITPHVQVHNDVDRNLYISRMLAQPMDAISEIATDSLSPTLEPPLPSDLSKEFIPAPTFDNSQLLQRRKLSHPILANVLTYSSYVVFILYALDFYHQQSIGTWEWTLLPTALTTFFVGFILQPSMRLRRSRPFMSLVVTVLYSAWAYALAMTYFGVTRAYHDQLTGLIATLTGLYSTFMVWPISWTTGFFWRLTYIKDNAEMPVSVRLADDTIKFIKEYGYLRMYWLTRRLGPVVSYGLLQFVIPTLVEENQSPHNFNDPILWLSVIEKLIRKRADIKPAYEKASIAEAAWSDKINAEIQRAREDGSTADVSDIEDRMGTGLTVEQERVIKDYQYLDTPALDQAQKEILRLVSSSQNPKARGSSMGNYKTNIKSSNSESGSSSTAFISFIGLLGLGATLLLASPPHSTGFTYPVVAASLIIAGLLFLSTRKILAQYQAMALAKAQAIEDAHLLRSRLTMKFTMPEKIKDIFTWRPSWMDRSVAERMARERGHLLEAASA